MAFDGSSSKEVCGVGVVLTSPSNKVISLSHKLVFESTNNVTGYEALILGLKDAKDMKIDSINVSRDVEMIIKQIKNIYQTKHPRLREYKNEV